MATSLGLAADPTHPESLVLIDKHNLAVLRRLAEDLVSKRPPAAFIGAGLTARSGLPTWEELIENLAQQIGAWKDQEPLDPDKRLEMQTPIADLRFSDNDLPWRANFCFDFFEAAERPKDYFDTLKAQFGKPPGENPVLDAVIRLPFAQFLTTNYDTAISQAHKRIHRRTMKAIDWGLGKPASALASGQRGGRCCLHLHGIFERPEGIILREDDYQQRYFEDQGHVEALRKFLKENPVVFIGFSLKDLDVLNVLRMLKAKHPRERGSHYALLPLSDEKPEQFIEMEKRRLSDKYGIQPIFYRRLTNRFLGMQEAIRLLTAYVERYEDDARAPKPRRPRTASRGGPKPFKFDIRKLDRPKVPDDPNKGNFGGSAVRNGRRLTAVVNRSGSSRWFRIELAVHATRGSPKLTDGGRFFVHPTFPKREYVGKLHDNGRLITRKFWAYGAFTVGVLVDKGETALEFDLVKATGAPKDFRDR